MHPDFATFNIATCIDNTHQIDECNGSLDDDVLLTIESMKAVQNSMNYQLQLLKESMANFKTEMAELHSIQDCSQQVLEYMQDGVRKVCSNLETGSNSI